jgi:hypothetical protein
MEKQLQPPKNFRTVIPHICATCRYLQTFPDEGYMACVRGVVTFDTGDRDDITSTCDRWRNGMNFGRDAFLIDEA